MAIKGKLKYFCNLSKANKKTKFGFVARRWVSNGDLVFASIRVDGGARHTSHITKVGFRSFTTSRSGNVYKY